STPAADAALCLDGHAVHQTLPVAPPGLDLSSTPGAAHLLVGRLGVPAPRLRARGARSPDGQPCARLSLARGSRSAPRNARQSHLPARPARTVKPARSFQPLAR